jgi:hypothetical protein
MDKVNSIRFPESLGRSPIFFMFKNRERWFPSRDGYILIYLQIVPHLTVKPPYVCTGPLLSIPSLASNTTAGRGLQRKLKIEIEFVYK